MEKYPQIILNSKALSAVYSFHPWVFSGAISKVTGHPQDGDVVELYDKNNSFLGTGHFSNGSIAVRIFSFAKVPNIISFLDKKLAAALSLRSALGLTNNPKTNAFRLVNAEGDGLPGLTIDIYNQAAVIECHSQGMKNWCELILHSLCRLKGLNIAAVYNGSPKAIDQKPSTNEPRTLLWGETVEPHILENSLKFYVDLINGQKTGFYLDQRENRALLELHAKGRTVLNAFCYTGAFSAYAIRGGAKNVCSIDSSKPSLELAEKNLALNFSSPPNEIKVADCLQFLKTVEPVYNLIILDPPAFVKHRSKLSGGLKGYETINFQALSKITNGGILFTFSCSQFVTLKDLTTIVYKSALKAKRQVKILHRLSQAPCHPISLFHPEGEYLKGLVLHVE